MKAVSCYLKTPLVTARQVLEVKSYNRHERAVNLGICASDLSVVFVDLSRSTNTALGGSGPELGHS